MQEFFEEYVLSLVELGILIIVARVIFSILEAVWGLSL